MKNYDNKAKNFLRMLYLVFVLLLTQAMLSSCHNEELEIRQNFPFEVSVMPIQKDIAKDETVEIRVKIQQSGNFAENKYCLRYFQFEGKGSLRYYSDTPYAPNDFYDLKEKEFRLYYTSTSKVSQSFTIWISDRFGTEKEIEFEFTSID